MIHISQKIKSATKNQDDVLFDSNFNKAKKHCNRYHNNSSSAFLFSITALIILYPSLTAKPKSTQLNIDVSINQTNVYPGGSLQAEVNVKSNGNPKTLL